MTSQHILAIDIPERVDNLSNIWVINDWKQVQKDFAHN